MLILKAFLLNPIVTSILGFVAAWLMQAFIYKAGQKKEFIDTLIAQLDDLHVLATDYWTEDQSQKLEAGITSQTTVILMNSVRSKLWLGDFHDDVFKGMFAQYLIEITGGEFETARRGQDIVRLKRGGKIYAELKSLIFEHRDNVTSLNPIDWMR